MKRKVPNFSLNLLTAHRVSLSGFFDVVGRDDDRSSMVCTQSNQMVPYAAKLGHKQSKTRKRVSFYSYEHNEKRNRTTSCSTTYLVAA